MNGPGNQPHLFPEGDAMETEPRAKEAAESPIDASLRKLKAFLAERKTKDGMTFKPAEPSPVQTAAAHTVRPKEVIRPPQPKIVMQPKHDGKMARAGIDKDDDLVDDGNGNWVMKKFAS